MSLCCVDGCRVASDDDDDEITYFQFPINRSLRRSWLDAIRATSKIGVNSVVCSQHFKDEDYEDYRGQKRLKSLVVPNVFVRDAKVESSHESEKSAKRTDKSKSKEKTKPDKTGEKRRTRSNTNNDRKANKQTSESENEQPQIENRNTTNNKKTIKNPKRKKLRKRRSSRGDTSDSDSYDEIKTRKKTKKETKRKKTETKASQGTDKIGDCANVAGQENDNNGQSNDKKVEEDDKSANVDEQRTDLDQGNGNLDSNKLVNDGKINGDNVVPSSNEIPQYQLPPEPNKPEDIEELLTNYHIQTNNSIPLRVEPLNEPSEPREQSEPSGECIDLDKYKEETPVFIEVPVDKADVDSSIGGDCLMLLESVQCEVDPAELMLHDYEPSVDLHNDHDEKQAISLLTSSDEDEVIIQEPNIDTVVVSDEDEDDAPLLSLVRPKAERLLEQNLDKLMWGVVDYYCYRCKFTTMSHGEYEQHVKGACSMAIQVCETCNYTTASKVQYARHKRKHKEERRYKCHVCNYHARHNMSLIYHLKSHEVTKLKRVKKGFKCEKCGFVSDVKLKVLRHVRLCMSDKNRYSCEDCDYETSRANDYKRHRAKKHGGDDDVLMGV